MELRKQAVMNCVELVSICKCAFCTNAGRDSYRLTRAVPLRTHEITHERSCVYIRENLFT